MRRSLLSQAEALDGDGNQTLPPGFHLVYLPFADDMRKLDYDRNAPKASDVGYYEHDGVLFRSFGCQAQTELMEKIAQKLEFKHFSSDAFQNPGSLHTFHFDHNMKPPCRSPEALQELGGARPGKGRT